MINFKYKEKISINWNLNYSLDKALDLINKLEYNDFKKLELILPNNVTLMDQLSDKKSELYTQLINQIITDIRCNKLSDGIINLYIEHNIKDVSL